MHPTGQSHRFRQAPVPQWLYCVQYKDLTVSRTKLEHEKQYFHSYPEDIHRKMWNYLYTVVPNCVDLFTNDATTSRNQSVFYHSPFTQIKTDFQFEDGNTAEWHYKVAPETSLEWFFTSVALSGVFRDHCSVMAMCTAKVFHKVGSTYTQITDKTHTIKQYDPPHFQIVPRKNM